MSDTSGAFIVDELAFERMLHSPCFSLHLENDGPPTIMITVVDNIPLAGQAHYVTAIRIALDPALK